MVKHSTKKILILAANPSGLRLDQEIRDIEDGIRRGIRREQFQVATRQAVRPKDIRRAIAEERPQIVHFCGHGTVDGSLVLEDDSRQRKPVKPEGLAALFELHFSKIREIAPLVEIEYPDYSSEVCERFKTALVSYWSVGMN